MKSTKAKELTYAAVCFGLFGFFLWRRIEIWFLFLGMAIFRVYKAFRKEKIAPSAQTKPAPPVKYFEFGTYAVDGDPSDQEFGIYMQLHGKPVFIHIKSDRHLEDRKKHALYLIANASALENNLDLFKRINLAFQARELSTIGLHSKEPERAELFWEPEGYTLLRGLEFVDD